MTNVEIISAIAHGFVDVETLQVYQFTTSDLSELTIYFGRGFEWHGHFKSGTYLIQFLANDVTPLDEDFDVCGIAFLPNLVNVNLYRIGE
jgi:hypothetical protein